MKMIISDSDSGGYTDIILSDFVDDMLFSYCDSDDDF